MFLGRGSWKRRIELYEACALLKPGITNTTPPTVAPQPLIPALGCLKFEQNQQFNWKIAIQLENAS